MVESAVYQATLREKVQKAKDLGYGDALIARELEISESAVRALLAGDMTSNYAALRIGMLIGQKGLTAHESLQMINAQIRKEQGFELDHPVKDYWNSLSNREMFELVTRALS